MKKIVLLIFLFLCLIAKTQNTYYKGVNGEVKSVIKTLSGGLAMLIKDTTLNLYKTDLNGNIIWVKQFHNSPKYQLPLRITQDLVDSSFYVSTGYVSSTPSYLMKIDKSGNLVWSKTLAVNAIYIRGCMGGGFVVAGSSNYDNYLLRFDNGGNIVWQNRYPNNFPNGGSFLPNIIQCRNSDYLVSVHCMNNGYDPQVYRVDSSGVLKWFNIYDLGADNEYVNLSVESNDKSILICGQSYTPIYYQSFYLRIDSLGNVLNFKRYHSVHDPIYEVILSTGPNRVLMAGNASYTGPNSPRGHYTYIDYTGTVLWSKTSLVPRIECGAVNTSDSFILGGPYSIAMIDSLGNGFCNSDTIILKDTTYFIPVLTPTVLTSAINYSTTSNVPSVTTPPATFTVYCNFTLGLNSEIKEGKEIFVFPNPVSSNFFFEINGNLIEENSEIIINDVLGRKVLLSKLQSGKNRIEAHDWKSGVYFYTITKENKLLSSGKICVVD